MSEVDDVVKTVLNVSLSVMLRKTALRKLRRVKDSVELSRAVVRVMQDLEDESLQRDCLSIAGEMCVKEAADVIFPISKSKSMNARYAVNTLGRLGGTKAYRYLFDLTTSNKSGPASYDAKRAMKEIKRREPNIEEEIRKELADLGSSFTELTRESLAVLAAADQQKLSSSPMNLESDKVDLVSDEMDLVSDKVDLVSDSSFDMPKPEAKGVELRGMVKALRENELLKEQVAKLEGDFSASESLRTEQVRNLSEQQQKLTQLEALEAAKVKLQKELALVNDSFRDSKKQWEKKLAKLEQKVKTRSTETRVTSDELKLNSLQKRVDGQQVIIDKLEEALNREQRKCERLQSEKDNKKSSNVGCIIMAVVGFFAFVMCR